jgi:hypothetical protein
MRALHTHSRSGGPLLVGLSHLEYGRHVRSEGLWRFSRAYSLARSIGDVGAAIGSGLCDPE